MTTDTTAASAQHLKAHQGNVASYHEVVCRTAKGRFGSTWWGVFDEHVSLDDHCTVVDLGTGAATLLEMLRMRHPKTRLIGVEVQPLMLASARETAERCAAEIVEADLATGVPLPDGVADTVTAVMTFHELIYPPKLLSEARRLLKPAADLSFTIG